MHRSTAAALAAILALPLTVLSATTAGADHRPKAKTKTVTLKTDAMPTRVQVTSQAGRVTCVTVAVGSGRDRKVWLTLEGKRDINAYTRLAARQTSKCLLAGTSAPRGSRLSIRVLEDLPGPFDPDASAALTL